MRPASLMSVPKAIAAPIDGSRVEQADRVVVNPYAQSVRPYALYALAVLTAANFLNYVDRQIISIVAEAMKADLKLSDAQLGFLLGTAFAVLYGVVGVAIGRISDATSRTKLMASGLAFWSAMTAASGAVTNYTQLAVARVGVGFGEATCNPCGQSLVTDYFPSKNRAAAFGVLLLGTYAGMGCSLLLGGVIIQNWAVLCHIFPGVGACRVANWKAAFLVVGAPGLLLAVLVANLKEPPRPPKHRNTPFGRLALTELSAAVPPFTLVNIARVGGVKALAANLALAVGLISFTVTLGCITHDWAQWIAVSVGIYSVSSWVHALSLKDRPLFKLTFGCPAFVLSLAGMSLTSCINGTVQIWAAPYAIRKLGATPTQAGLYVGLAFAVSAGIGVIVGGWLTDLWKRRDSRAPIWMALIGLIGPMPALALMMVAPNLAVFSLGFFVFGTICQGWGGGAAALAQDLTLPRMRGTTAASFSLIIIVVTSGFGPYWAGKISTLTGSLTTGLLSLLALAPFAVILLLMAARRLRRESEETRRARARAAGEPI
jgi:MFS family permease